MKELPSVSSVDLVGLIWEQNDGIFSPSQYRLYTLDGVKSGVRCTQGGRAQPDFSLAWLEAA
jgi:hypothetical protein